MKDERSDKDDQEGSASEGEDLSEVEQLKMQVAQLHQVCVETREELLTHRQVLEQCLELREAVQEVLENRETLQKCIGMEESIQAVAGGARVIEGLGDKQMELDQSLAGVSDNTARHGKAISTLVEQQKQSSATLDAVVRAVKRLAASRSRSRGRVAPPGTEATNFASSGSTVPQVAYLPNVLQGLKPSQDRPAGNEDAAAISPSFSGAQPDEWLGGQADPDEPQPRLLAEPVEDGWGGLVEELVGRYGGCAEDGEWSAGAGWPPLEEVDGRRGLPCLPGGAEWRTGGGATSEEEMRYWSGSSSCGSDGRAFHSARSNGSHRPVRGSSRGGFRAGIPDVGFGGPGDLGGMGGPELGRGPGPVRGHSRRSAGPNGASIASPEMANCVQGVLARIEEALTKLDGPDAEAAPADSARSQRAVLKNVEGRGGRERPRSANRPHSARGPGTPRSGGTPRATTPRSRAAPYDRAVNSWA